MHCKLQTRIVFYILFFSYIFLPALAVSVDFIFYSFPFAIEPPALCEGMLNKVQMLLNFENVYIETM